MSKKLFITGATGYIGGSVLQGIVDKFPELQFSALLRAPTSEFTSRYPHISVIKGSFDDAAVIEEAAEAADIVIHTGDTDHEGCANAILSGLAKRHVPSFFIHLTGTGCISDADDYPRGGDFNPHVWNDVTDVRKIYDLPESKMHHVVDKRIMETGGLVKTACVCPPDIYGQSTGTGARTTFLVPKYVEVVRSKGAAFYVGEGQNVRAVSHIEDVVSAFVVLLGEALEGGGKAQWGMEGFYFAVTGGVKWKEAAEAVTKLGIKDGWLPKDSKPVSWTREQLEEAVPGWPTGIVLYLWGSNSRADSERLRRLGWKPSGPSFWEALPGDVEVTIKNLKA